MTQLEEQFLKTVQGKSLIISFLDEILESTSDGFNLNGLKSNSTKFHAFSMMCTIPPKSHTVLLHYN